MNSKAFTPLEGIPIGDEARVVREIELHAANTEPVWNMLLHIAARDTPRRREAVELAIRTGGLPIAVTPEQATDKCYFIASVAVLTAVTDHLDADGLTRFDRVVL